MKYEGLKRIFHQNEKRWMDVYNRRFNSEFSHHLGVLVNGKECFYVMNEEILNLIDQIYSVNHELDVLPFPELGKRYAILSSVLEEIRSSNKIEGIHSTHQELKELTTEKKSNQSKRFYGIVKKYGAILNKEFENVESCADVHRLYKDILYRDVLENDPTAKLDGLFFRKNAVGITTGIKTIYKGIDGEENIISWMDQSLKILYDESINLFLRVAIFHYLFEYIHPFYDGNGRMGRFLACGYLSKRMNDLCAFQFSSACLHDKKNYYKMFEETSNKMNCSDLTVFIIQFLEIYLKGLKELNKVIVEKNEYYWNLRNYLKKNFAKEDFSFLDKLLQITIFGLEGFTMAEMVENENMTEQTLRNRIKKINKKHPIIKVDMKHKPYHYVLDIEALYMGKE